MKTKILSLFLAVVMLFSVLSVGATAESLTEVPEGYVGVYTKDDLSNMRNDLSANYILMNDIIFSEEDFEENGDFYNDGACWIPVGTDADNAFSGIFDGNNYAIKNLRINYVNTDTENVECYAGFFGYSTGIIKNLSIIDGKITSGITVGTLYLGGIAGYSVNISGCISDCDISYITDVNKNEQNFYDSICVAGITGINSDNIENCINYSCIKLQSETKEIMKGAGITVLNNGTINNCFNYGDIKALSVIKANTAGICIENSKDCLIQKCGNQGNIYAVTYISSGGNSASSEAAGINTKNYSTIKQCYNTGYISSESKGLEQTSAISGGIVADSDSSTKSRIYACFNVGFLKAYSEAKNHDSQSRMGSQSYAGGIVAYGSATVENCFNAGDVIENCAYIAGQSPYGYYYFTCNTVGIKPYLTESYNCYNIGDVKNSYKKVIPRPGYNADVSDGQSYGIAHTDNTSASPYSYANLYFLDGCAKQTLDKKSIVSCTNDEMKLQETYAGFDFENIWYMDASSGYPYPQLQGMPVPSLPILLTEDEVTIHQGKTAQIEISAIPSVVDGEVTYKALDENVATVTADGIVTAVSTGETEIEVSCGSAKTYYTVVVEGHSFDEADAGNITSEATCKQDGAYEKVCLICLETVEFSIEKLPHAEEIIEGYSETCTEVGMTDGLKCVTCGDILLKQMIIPATGHSHTSEVTTPATHLAEGVMTFTCACGDTYTEAIAKTTEHSHNAVVTAPTCTEQGFTTYTCECGDSYVADYVDASGHDYKSEVTTPATHLKEGVMTYTCHCGDSYTESIAKIEKHKHTAVVTAPTCTEDGYTTYTCECGDSYVADYVDATGHSHTSEITTPATHISEGVMTFTCECGDTYTEEIEKTAEHSYKAVVTAPTCTEDGYTNYTCKCGDSYVADYIKAFHKDADKDYVCDICNKLINAKEVKDEQTDVSIVYSDGTFNDEINIEVTPVAEGDAFKLISHKEGNYKVTMFDINVTVNGENVQPNGTVLVKIPLPRGYNQNKCVVYYVADDGTLEELKTYHFKDGYVYFETDHFSYYAIIEEEYIGPNWQEESLSFIDKLTEFFNMIMNFFKKIFGII